MTSMRAQVSRSARIAAWLVLGGAGGITMTYNIWHATHAGHMLVGLALLYGFGPVFIAALLSHIVAEYDGGWFLKGVVFAAMLGAMSMSIGATADVIGATAGPVLRWVFGAVLDTAALVALRVILDGRKRDTEAADALLAAQSQARSAGDEAARLGARLEAVTAEMEALHFAAPAAAPEPAPATAPQRRSAPRRRAPADDLTLEAKALQLLATNLDMSGAELARKLGVSPGYGRKLRARLTAQDRPEDRSAPAAPERPAERPQER